MKKYKLLIAGILLITLAGCASTSKTNSTTVVSQDTQYNLISKQKTNDTVSVITTTTTDRKVNEDQPVYISPYPLVPTYLAPPASLYYQPRPALYYNSLNGYVGTGIRYNYYDGYYSAYSELYR